MKNYVRKNKTRHFVSAGCVAMGLGLATLPFVSDTTVKNKGQKWYRAIPSATADDINQDVNRFTDSKQGSTFGGRYIKGGAIAERIDRIPALEGENHSVPAPSVALGSEPAFGNSGFLCWL